MKHHRVPRIIWIAFLFVIFIKLYFVEFASAQNFSNGFNFYLPETDTASTRFIPQFPRVPLTDQDFISIDQDGHFSVQGKPIRFFGTVLYMPSAFPDKSKSWFVAGRLRKMGFNITRLATLDNDYTYNYDYSLFQQGSTTRLLNTTTLDKLEKLISELKSNGIYIDIPIFTYRKFNSLDGVPDADSLQYPFFGDGTHFFDPQILSLNKEYAQQLLTHINPYTGKSLANDPVLALVEISNEKSLYRNWFDGQLKHFSAGGVLTWRHTKMLDSLWVAYLKSKYTSTSALANAWNTGAVSHSELLVNGSFEDNPPLNKWEMLFSYGTTANASADRDSLFKHSGKYSAKVVVSQSDGTDWHVQFKQDDLSLTKNSPYMISFNGKSDSSRSINVGMLKVSPQTGYGGMNILLTPQWKTYSFNIQPSESASDVRLYFCVGGQAGIYWFDDVSIPTGVAGILSDESLETSFVRRIDYTDCWKYTEQRVRDMSSFYVKVQDDYYAQMRSYLKDTLHVKVPIVGTNANIGPPDIVVQSKMDYVDNHTYWDHPSTLSSLTDWYIDNAPMVRSNLGGTIAPGMCAVPAKGKPFMMSEYNHAFPNRYQSEGPLFITAYSSFQDADGFMFCFYYSPRPATPPSDWEDWEKDWIEDWFSIHHNSAMMTLMPSCALAYRTGMISKARQTLLVNYAPDDYLLLPRNNFGRWWETTFADKKLALKYGVRTNSFTSTTPFDASTLPAAPASPYITDTKEITWNTNGLLSVASNRFVGATGFLNNFTNQSIGPLTIKSASGFGTLTWISLTSDSLQKTLRSLLTISTRAQNTGMVWNSNYTSVGDNWGTSPTTVEPLTLSLQLSMTADSIRVYPLDTLGRETKGYSTYFPVRPLTGIYNITIDQSVSRSMWFGIEKFKGNMKPFLNFRAPAAQDTISRNNPRTFAVSITAPTGDQVTYVWKINNMVMKSGMDSSYTVTFSDPVNTLKSVTVVFSIPSGLKDSTTWNVMIVTAVAERELIPKEFALAQNYPNPFNSTTKIKYDLPVTSRVALRVYDLLGRVVVTLVDGIIPAGYHEVVVNSDNLSSGMYFYHLTAGSYMETKKLMLLK